ncbi:MAG: hypothetical protein J6S14_14015 [Clostridia bacterium]|nr:hypothetical protein [Clostridia bacterium]
MKTTRPDGIRFPRVYQSFDSMEQIGNVINRSRSYVAKALKNGFTAREWEMLSKFADRDDLTAERKI